MIQLIKDSPSKIDQNGVKVQAANDAVQAIKQLRRETVEIMSQLLCLAKAKNPKNMLTLCNEMVTKTKVLLNIWEPSLVEEAFAFIEQHRIIEEPDNITVIRIIAVLYKPLLNIFPHQIYSTPRHFVGLPNNWVH